MTRWHQLYVDELPKEDMMEIRIKLPMEAGLLGDLLRSISETIYENGFDAVIGEPAPGEDEHTQWMRIIIKAD